MIVWCSENPAFGKLQTVTTHSKKTIIPVHNRIVPVQDPNFPGLKRNFPVSNPKFPVHNRIVPVSNPNFPVPNPDFLVSNHKFPVSNPVFPVWNPDFVVRNPRRWGYRPHWHKKIPAKCRDSIFWWGFMIHHFHLQQEAKWSHADQKTVSTHSFWFQNLELGNLLCK